MVKTFGSSIKTLRKSLKLSTRILAPHARISVSYYEKIENGRAVPPPRITCERLLESLELTREDEHELLLLAAKERGSTDAEEQLPLPVRELLKEIRLYANDMRPAFIDYLRTTVRSVKK